MAFEREFQKKCETEIEEILTIKEGFTVLLSVRGFLYYVVLAILPYDAGTY